jgi:hypothetical protein
MGMNNLALALGDQDKYEEAEMMYREALVVEQRVLGKEHPDTLKSMNNLAAVLREHGKLEVAEVMAREALTTQQRALGKEHGADGSR